jgi:SIR2-like domain
MSWQYACMQVRDALDVLCSDGFALWVGNGVSQWISGAEGQATVPSWPELVDQLEAKAGLGRLDLHVSFPQRLERVHLVLGFVEFQAALREAILGRVANSILVASWRLGSSGLPPIPTRAVQLAKLGHLANPIVNFNVETLTSLALACAGGPMSIKAFKHPRPTELNAFGSPRSIYPEGVQQIFLRHVYHPHGAIEIAGICVMTETEYRTQEATLAFEVATHSAFMSNLAIVGMSLEDAYLREQLSRFRQQIRKIFWFTTLAKPRTRSPSDEVAAWASWADIKVVDAGSWPEFWEAVGAWLPMPDDLCLLNAWEFVCKKADDHLEGRIREIANFMKSRISGEPLPPEISRLHRDQAAEGGESLDQPLRKEFTPEQLNELWKAFQDCRRNLAR